MFKTLVTPTSKIEIISKEGFKYQLLPGSPFFIYNPELEDKFKSPFIKFTISEDGKYYDFEHISENFFEIENSIQECPECGLRMFSTFQGTDEIKDCDGEDYFVDTYYCSMCNEKYEEDYN